MTPIRVFLASLIIKEGSGGTGGIKEEFYMANAPGVSPEAFLEVPSGPFKPNNI